MSEWHVSSYNECVWIIYGNQVAIIEAHTFIYSTKVCVHMRNTADEDEAFARGAYFPLLISQFLSTYWWKWMTRIQTMPELKLYRSCLASSIESDLVPCWNKDPCGSEGGHVFEILPDILCCPFENFWLGGLPVVHVSADAIVHICPEWSNKWPAVTQGKSLWCELANLHVEGDYTIVVDLWEERRGFLFQFHGPALVSFKDIDWRTVEFRAYIDRAVRDIEENKGDE